MKTQRKLLSILGITSIIGGGSALSVLATSCGGNGPFVEQFSLFDDVSVSTEAQAVEAMETVTWIYEHCSEYSYSDYQLYNDDIPCDYDLNTPSVSAWKDSIIYRFGGNDAAGADGVRNEMLDALGKNGIICTPTEVSIWCELVYDMSWQYCNSINFKISNFEIGGFQDPALWCDADGQGIGGTAYIHTVYESGVDGSGIVLDNEGEEMDTKYVNGYFADMELSDDSTSNIYNKSFTCSWGTTSVYLPQSSSRHTIHTKKLFGIGETGHFDLNMATGEITFYDEPTLYWFNTSFILQNCI